MAHNISKTNGKDAFVSVREIPWHKLGFVVDAKMTSAECMALSGLDYDVGLADVFGKAGEQYVNIPRSYATYRKDTNVMFGVVGSRYTIVQNKEAFRFFDVIVGEGAAIYETAGALGKGERVFMTAKLPKHIKVGKDVIEQYLFLTNSHDGTGSVHVAFTPTRIVCHNTLQMALRSSSRVVMIRHTAGAQKQLEQAHRLMGITARNTKTMAEALNGAAKVKITDKELRRFITMAMHPEREQMIMPDHEAKVTPRFEGIVDDVIRYYQSHPSQQTAETKGTLYGALNAVTGYYQNVKDYRTDEKRMRSIIYGAVKRKSAIAMDLTMQVLTGYIKLS